MSPHSTISVLHFPGTDQEYPDQFVSYLIKTGEDLLLGTLYCNGDQGLL